MYSESPIKYVWRFVPGMLSQMNKKSHLIICMKYLLHQIKSIVPFLAKRTKLSVQLDTHGQEKLQRKIYESIYTLAEVMLYVHYIIYFSRVKRKTTFLNLF